MNTKKERLKVGEKKVRGSWSDKWALHTFKESCLLFSGNVQGHLTWVRSKPVALPSLLIVAVVLCFIWRFCLLRSAEQREIFCFFHSNYLFFAPPPPGGICEHPNPIDIQCPPYSSWAEKSVFRSKYSTKYGTVPKYSSHQNQLPFVSFSQDVYNPVWIYILCYTMTSL